MPRVTLCTIREKPLENVEVHSILSNNEKLNSNDKNGSLQTLCEDMYSTANHLYIQFIEHDLT